MAVSTETSGPSSTDLVIVVSSDSHVGPLTSQLRPYCPRRYLDDFDGFTSGMKSEFIPMTPGGDRKDRQLERHLRTAGHYDIQARLTDMDRDGVAAEVIYHGGQNGQPLPFSSHFFLFTDTGSIDVELQAVGVRMYN